MIDHVCPVLGLSSILTLVLEPSFAESRHWIHPIAGIMTGLEIVVNSYPHTYHQKE
jgi:cobalamin biosynthesis protein CobD/CbiB